MIRIILNYIIAYVKVLLAVFTYIERDLIELPFPWSQLASTDAGHLNDYKLLGHHKIYWPENKGHTKLKSWLLTSEETTLFSFGTWLLSRGMFNSDWCFQLYLHVAHGDSNLSLAKMLCDLVFSGAVVDRQKRA